MKNRITRIAVAGFLAALFALSLIGCNSPSTFAAGTQNQPQPSAVTTSSNLQPALYDDRTPAYVAPRRVVRPAYATSYATAPAVQRPHRSWERSAVIIGASSGTGAVIGGLAHGGKGAAIGAIAGGAAGLIYDRLTANK
jgi:hypothetical protein